MGSCRGSHIRYVDNVFGFGYQSIGSTADRSTSIREVSGDVYCLAPLSCAAASIRDVNTIYAGGDQSLHSTEIHDVEDSIFAYGTDSLSLSLIYNVENGVYCIGTSSCQNSEIHNVTSVIADGKNALSGAAIVGGPESLYVSINNDNNETIDIYCDGSQFCLVNCGSSGACSKVRLWCRESCLTVCDDEGGVECPTVLDFSDDTPAPTDEPDCELVVVTDTVGAGISSTVMIGLLISMGALCVFCMGDRRKHKHELSKLTQGTVTELTQYYDDGKPKLKFGLNSLSPRGKHKNDGKSGGFEGNKKDTTTKAIDTTAGADAEVDGNVYAPDSDDEHQSVRDSDSESGSGSRSGSRSRSRSRSKSSDGDEQETGGRGKAEEENPFDNNDGGTAGKNKNTTTSGNDYEANPFDIDG